MNELRDQILDRVLIQLRDSYKGKKNKNRDVVQTAIDRVAQIRASRDGWEETARNACGRVMELHTRLEAAEARIHSMEMERI